MGVIPSTMVESRMSDTAVILRSDSLAATIAPLGAELRSLVDAQGRQLMTDADPRWWTGHAPLLFPFVGRSRGDVYRYAGREYPMAQHGFARNLSFVLLDRSDRSALFRLSADDGTRAIYPFDFSLDMGFALDGATLGLTASISNDGDRPMPFSFGYHPAFAWPLPFGGTVEDHRIVFEQPEPAPIRRVGAEPGLIAAAPSPSPVIGDTLSPTHQMFEGDALIWDDLASRALLWGVPGRPRLRIAFPDTPWLGLWQKPGAHYLCVEPWAGMADLEGFEGTVWEKQGIMTLAPGDTRRFRMDVTVTD